MTTCKSWCGKVTYEEWLVEARASLEPMEGYEGRDQGWRRVSRL